MGMNRNHGGVIRRFLKPVLDAIIGTGIRDESAVFPSVLMTKVLPVRYLHHEIWK